MVRRTMKRKGAVGRSKESLFVVQEFLKFGREVPRSGWALTNPQT